MEKREPSCTVCRNVNWYRHYGEQYGGSLKKKNPKNRTAKWPRNPTPGHIAWESHNSQRPQQAGVHGRHLNSLLSPSQFKSSDFSFIKSLNPVSQVHTHTCTHTHAHTHTHPRMHTHNDFIVYLIPTIPSSVDGSILTVTFPKHAHHSITPGFKNSSLLSNKPSIPYPEVQTFLWLDSSPYFHPHCSLIVLSSQSLKASLQSRAYTLNRTTFLFCNTLSFLLPQSEFQK